MGRTEGLYTGKETCRYFAGSLPRELSIYPESREVWLGAYLLTLTRYEFDLICLLAWRHGRVFFKEQIYTHVWKEGIGIPDNDVQCVISSLRRKLRKYTDKEYIQTVWESDINLYSWRRERFRKAE